MNTDLNLELIAKLSLEIRTKLAVIETHRVKIAKLYSDMNTLRATNNSLINDQTTAVQSDINREFAVKSTVETELYKLRENLRVQVEGE